MKRGKGCDGKQAHRTRAEAEAHAVAVRHRVPEGLDVYWCSTHGAWHVGHRPMPRSKRRRY